MARFSQKIWRKMIAWMKTLSVFFGEDRTAVFANNRLKVLAICRLRSVFLSGILPVTRFQSTNSSRFIPIIIKNLFVYAFVHFLCNFILLYVSLTKICSHPSVVTIEASAWLNFAKISPSSVRTVSAKSKTTKQLKKKKKKLNHTLEQGEFLRS